MTEYDERKLIKQIEKNHTQFQRLTGDGWETLEYCDTIVRHCKNIIIIEADWNVPAFENVVYHIAFKQRNNYDEIIRWRKPSTERTTNDEH